MSHAKFLPFCCWVTGSWGFLGCCCPPRCDSRCCSRGDVLESWNAPPAGFGGVLPSLVEDAAGCQVSLLKPLSASRVESAGRFSCKVVARLVSGVRTVIFISPLPLRQATSTRRSTPTTSNFMSRTGLPLTVSGAASARVDSCVRVGLAGSAAVGSGGEAVFTCTSGVCGDYLARGRDGGRFDVVRRRHLRMAFTLGMRGCRLRTR